MAQSPVAMPEAEPSVTEAPRHQLDVLIVDDNPTNLMVLDQILSTFGHRVVKASSGLAALDLAAQRPFDLVLMDIQMPDMTGTETLSRLRASPGPNQWTAVIALTADVTSGGRPHYLKLGFTDHTTKPIQISELMDSIERAMTAGSVERSADALTG
jgi:CheY-like chemotaxis protein